jgi:hypothetical protein
LRLALAARAAAGRPAFALRELRMASATAVAG